MSIKQNDPSSVVTMMNDDAIMNDHHPQSSHPLQGENLITWDFFLPWLITGKFYNCT